MFSLLGLLCLISSVYCASIVNSIGRGVVFNAVKGKQYGLEKQLAAGDVITAWGVYSNIKTAKFSVNILAPNNYYLIHVDFRPFNDVVVLNSHEPNKGGWQREIRPAFSKNNFKDNTIFKVRVEVHDKEFKIFFNDKELSKTFPHRLALSRAQTVVLHGGSAGFKWGALHLPAASLGEAKEKVTWCSYSNKYLSTYSAGVKAYTTLAEAQKQCRTRSDCSGITQEPNNGNRYTLRKYSDLRGSPSKETSWKICSEVEDNMSWCSHANKYLSTYSAGVKAYTTLTEAQKQCRTRSDCSGITREPNNGNRYTLRKYSDLRASPSKETSWKMCIPSNLVTTSKFSRALVPGDSITGWGVFASKTSKFNINLVKANGHIMIHVDFRPPPSENKVVLNSKQGSGWQTELRTAMPGFVNGEAFKVTLKCGYDKFRIFVNDKELGSTFPYRAGLALADVASVALWGGSNGMVWTDIQLPAINKYGSNLLTGKATANQNSMGWNGPASRAIDGNTNGNYFAYSCTHSAGTKNNWWSVTLPQLSTINQVVVYNRQDCCKDRINRAKVYVGDEFCGEIKYSGSTNVYPVSCNGVVGKVVKIVQNNNYLTLCEVMVLGTPSGNGTQLSNVAPGHPTWQSSVGWGGESRRAVDKNSNPYYSTGSCTHSANTGFNQWKVNLVDKFDIDTVVIHNRVDCCANRLNGAKVYVGNQECGTILYKAGQNVYSVKCGMTGTAVKITQEGQYLTLCEVEVLAKKSEKETRFVNVAKGGVATQDSIGWEGAASRAVDGITSGNYWDKSCSHNGDLKDTWWNLELAEATTVAKIVVYNRADCCQDRINLAQVYVDDFKCGTIRYVQGQRIYQIGCSDPKGGAVSGSNVRIKGQDGKYLTLCEVKVLSDPKSTDSNLVNLAYNKPTKQSSTGWGGESGRAVDGKLSGKWTAGTCTHTAGAGWWSVDLEGNYNVQQVVIINRVDCCQSRLDGTEVYVGDMLCGTVKYNQLVHRYTISCGATGIVSDTVKIVNKKTYLTLCEVKVLGEEKEIEVTTDKVVVGPDSGPGDDKKSEAVCAAGYVVKSCKTIKGEVHNTCDGVYVPLDDGSKCVAVNSYRGSGAKARAVCALNDQHEDPCNGPNLPTYKHFFAKGAAPKVTCPKGYEQTVCNGWSPWIGKLKGVGKDGVIANDKPCAVSGCSPASGSGWCTVSNVCKLSDDMTGYAADVCSTCAGYHCGEDEECVMLDTDDDASDAEVPTCVEIQTGCDNNDRCGSEGVCVPVGKADYKCHCGDGDEYSEETGSCLPVHTAWEKVYGEAAIGDDAISYAQCPEGKAVMRCHSYGVPTATDGVYITVDAAGISKCIARASHKKTYGVKAVAYCGTRQVVVDPCTQDDIHTTEYRYSSDHSPSIKCPGGYMMASCIFHSPWSQDMSAGAKGLVESIGSVKVASGVCSVPSCLNEPTEERKYCKLTAVCTKLTGDEYVKAACPTCDRVKCAEDYECEMVEGLPQCLPRIVGPCEEVNQCGDAGECIEQGTNYTCTCKSGYKFDGKTCADVNECAEEPCVNGKCENSPGSYTCECMEGYIAEKGTCIDIDECEDKPCSDSESCSNTEGSYICDCLDTFYRDAAGDCVCAEGFAAGGGSCQDVDECKEGVDECKENEICDNKVGNYECNCKEGYERGPDGTCKDFTPADCGVYPVRDHITTFTGKNVKVNLKGELKKDFKKYATIQWTKDGEVWDPSAEGKEKFNGFTIRDFQAEDAGTYVGSIFIEKPNDENFKCSVTVRLALKEGSVKISIKNREDLASTKPAGKGLAIMCLVSLTNVDLEDVNDANNVNWYKVVPGAEDVLVDEGDRSEISINKKKGTYRLWFVSPQAAHSGTYKCEFDQQDVSASTEVSIVFE